jgi:hypothetical protein
MHGNMRAVENRATKSTDRTVSNLPDTGTQTGGQTGSEDFPAKLRAIAGKDAGLTLHLLTGIAERSCYRYANGERTPSFEFIVSLFHSEHGQPFFDAFMDDCKARWWLELQRHRRMGEAADKAR